MRLRAVGRHNIYNALAAAAAAMAAGMPLEAVKYGLDDFVPVAMRSELKVIKGRTVLADYYNANPGSVKAALETLVTLRPGARSVAVLGDMLELGETGAEEHRAIGRTAARLGVDAADHRGPAGEAHRSKARVEAGMAEEAVSSRQRSHAEAAALLREAVPERRRGADQGIARHEDGKDPGGVLMLYHLLYPLSKQFSAGSMSSSTSPSGAPARS